MFQISTIKQFGYQKVGHYLTFETSVSNVIVKQHTGSFGCSFQHQIGTSKMEIGPGVYLVIVNTQFCSLGNIRKYWYQWV